MRRRFSPHCTVPAVLSKSTHTARAPLRCSRSPTHGRHTHTIVTFLISSSSSSLCSSLTSRDSTPPPATSPLSPPVHPPASKKCTFDAAFPSPLPCYPSSPLDDEAPDWIEVRHRVLLFKEWREKRRRGDKEEGCSLMRVALETPA